MIVPPPSPAASVERIPTCVYADAHDISVAVAQEIADLIRARAQQGKTAVLGLATGSSPTSVYNELVRMHETQGLSFKNVITFNLDEYFPMRREDLQSYYRFMHEYLFDRIDINPQNAHVPDGTIPRDQVSEFCRRYEQMIADAGGIDIQVLGIGRTGHIGFNEPGSPRDSRTRLITLDKITRLDAASDFFGEQFVPRRALTMGVATILAARKIILVAFGENKSAILKQAIEGPVTPSVAASFLQEHPHARMMLDAAAAAGLTRCHAPWLLGPVAWDKTLIAKAVIWLARKTQKPILKLTAEDYNEAGLQDLLTEHGPNHGAHEINLDVFRALQETITGWPGGKPDSMKRPGDIHRPTDAVFPKRVLVFSPHPDDDVISMGGTLIRLVDQGHEVYVGYQTSGAIAVFDGDALRFTDFVSDFNHAFQTGGQIEPLEAHLDEFLKKKKPAQVDSQQVQLIKTLIRRGEARAAARECGVNMEHVRFLDMPFYQTGTVVKKPLSEKDIQLVTDLLEEVQPHQIYAAGDLTDPHGTHRVCLAAIFTALQRLRKQPWFAQTEIWLYRGAWQEWEPHDIEMAVPLSPDELVRKRMAIFKHQSQKDKAMFPGADEREFWQRAEDRNRATAKLYDQLGLSEFEAIEGFVRWTPK